MDHWNLITERSYRIIGGTIDVLSRHRIDFVLGGGWAVFSYVPSVPSVDTDIFMDRPLPDAALRDLTAAGFAVGPGKEIEVMATDEHLGFWAFGDEDLGIPIPGFQVEAVLREQRSVPLRLGGVVRDVLAPVPPALALLKLCALHNRDLALRSFRSGEAGMLVGPERMPMIRMQSESYYLRKAGKDLFDVAAVLRLEGVANAFLAQASLFGLSEILPQICPQLAGSTRAYASELAESVGHPDPHAAVAAILARAGRDPRR